MDSISFDTPQFIHLIWIFPILWAIVLGSRYAASEKIKKTMGLQAHHELTKNTSQTKRKIKTTFLAIAWILLVMTAMGPRWGYHLKEVSRKGLDMMICLDVSRSMLAEDVLPNRLERTKLDLKDMVNVLKGDRVGLIAFAGAAVSACPMTLDRYFLRQSLDQLSPQSAPRGGTFVGDAIRKAMNSFSKSEGRTRVIILVTDGEDQDSLPLEAAKEAASRGIKIFTIGLGSNTRGTPIPITENGLKKNLMHQGKLVLSKLNSDILKQISQITDGAYIPAGTSVVDLAGIYQKHILPLERLEEDKQQINRLQARFQWFLLAAIIFIFLDCLLGTRRLQSELST